MGYRILEVGELIEKGDLAYGGRQGPFDPTNSAVFMTGEFGRIFDGSDYFGSLKYYRYVPDRPDLMDERNLDVTI